MENLTKLAVEAALASGASYADARAVDRRSERARVKNGSVEALSDGRSQGVGVRVIADGAWGFAGCAERSEGAVRAAARRAVELARAAATTIDEPVRLADVEPVIGSHATEVAIDPADVPLDDRLALLMECDRLMRAEDVEVAVSFVSVLRSAQHFASRRGRVDLPGARGDRWGPRGDGRGRLRGLPPVIPVVTRRTGNDPRVGADRRA